MSEHEALRRCARGLRREARLGREGAVREHGASGSGPVDGEGSTQAGPGECGRSRREVITREAGILVSHDRRLGELHQGGRHPGHSDGLADRWGAGWAPGPRPGDRRMAPPLAWANQRRKGEPHALWRVGDQRCRRHRHGLVSVQAGHPQAGPTRFGRCLRGRGSAGHGAHRSRDRSQATRGRRSPQGKLRGCPVRCPPPHAPPRVRVEPTTGAGASVRA